jgi:hypothetical protein
VKTCDRNETIAAIWSQVDNSITGYGDLIEMCLRRLTDEHLLEILTSLRGGEPPDEDPTADWEYPNDV